ncbi:glycosyltransferase [Cribrihabitans pelagius]|uniref:glycosyltransferase n=1 Tax=Cribrihabitans pelagius TaxID=1765746 RepID=UPI003B5A3FBA
MNMPAPRPAAAASRFSPVRGVYPLQRYVREFGASAVNAFDLDAWRRATCLTWLGTRLVVRSGRVRVVLRHITADGTATDLARAEQDGTGTQLFPDLCVSGLEGALLPVVEEESPDANFDILFATDDQPAAPQLRINYIFCTFKRAEYVQYNAGVFRDYLRRHRDQAAAHLTVIDNGSDQGSNDCGVEPDADVTVLPNNNTGGAGGFGRGIYESCYGALAQQGFTHVCLLDDDIYLHPEMFARNTAFMRFLKPGFHVGAPMYPASSEQRIPRHSACFGHKYRQSVHPSDSALGAGLDTADIPAFLAMDRAPDSTGWWWSCFAVSDVHRIGLPYPFFIKMDDVEYGLRLRDAGVELVIPFSFWVLHDDFEEKYSAAMQYFRFRNRWVLLAQQGRLDDPQGFAMEYDRLVRGFVSARKYEHAQLLLDAMRHFLNGPEYLIRNEKEILAGVFRTVADEKNAPMPAPPEGAAAVNGLEPPASARTARLNARTWNNHFLPLKEQVAIDTTRPSQATDCRRGKQVSYWNPDKGIGFTVTRDSRRALRQMLTLRRLRQAAARKLPATARAYQAAKPHLTSQAFWAGYGKFGTRPPLQPGSAESLALQDLHQQAAHLQAGAAQAAARARAPVTDEDNAFFNALRNRHLGQRCFVLGNGPSLTVSDLELLKDEITFAANKIYLCFDETEWRPTFYSVEDLLVAQNCRAEILAVDRTTKIFAHHMLPYLPRQANHHYARWLPPADNRSPFREFSADLTKGICWGSTITYSMLQMAVHMGFKEIYILGLDHSYVEPKTREGGALVSEGEVNHFHPDYRKPGEKWHYPVLDRLEHSYQFAKDYCDSIGVRIYNASRFSKLETFPRADLDAVLQTRTAAEAAANSAPKTTKSSG